MGETPCLKSLSKVSRVSHAQLQISGLKGVFEGILNKCGYFETWSDGGGTSKKGITDNPILEKWCLMCLKVSRTT